ncbi:toxin biosynthesis protein-like protein [Hortaea werneckii]|nr:toxin biosynthesis protein-like protein [Hortaea werneckii]KAI6885416.1 toxin biosynthesis protein-like protein [Hortaea werneckii]KAI6995400.1 toxin biosynthesis protein-like protein [Hortaea werneckii]KAI7146816.1 toxin biosynthesis protein-like protein [Hortaea werneckii]KAI7175863.1 toxin biosynthesis protein-like protein [Hortaea werneckii]
MSASKFSVREHVLPTSHIREYPHATSGDQEDVLQLAVKQYTPRRKVQAKTTITIIGGHANGFPKELYEPLWDDLLERLQAKDVAIGNIFIADVAHQGTSGVLNEEKLGNDPSWLDHPRDLFLMVNHFRREMKRPIVGIGHSMGGNNLVNLSLMHPRLFSSLILIDPVIQRFQSRAGNYGPARASTNRRDRWPSREAARAAFKRSKFYQSWDPRVLELWIRYGLRELPTNLYPYATAASATPPTISADPGAATVSPAPDTEREVTLATTKHQEVFTFLRPNLPTKEFPEPSTESNLQTHPDMDPASGPNAPFYRPEPIATFHRLPNLRPSVFYLFGEQSNLSTPTLKADKLAHTGTGVGGSGGVRKGRVRDVTLEGVGHLIPMEAVERTAEECTQWLVPEIEGWTAREEAERREWAAVPKEEKAVLSEQYRQTMNGNWTEKQEGAKSSKL